MRTKMRIAASIFTAMLLLLTFVGQSQARSLVASHRLIPLSLPSPLYNNVKLDDDTTTPKIIPSWWTGTNGYACDDANYYANSSPHTHSSQLGTTTNYRGVKACGPRPISGGPEAGVQFYTTPTTAPTEYEWDCTELVKRYLYQAFGAPDLSANGKDVVSAYTNSTNNDLFQSYPNNSTANQMPVAGNVVSFAGLPIPNTNPVQYTAGHTAVVTAVSVGTNGNGTVNIMEQNSSSNGTNTLYVGNPVINGVAKDPGNAAWHTDTESGVGAVTGWLDTKTQVPSYNATSYDNSLKAVSAYSANNVWAVGSLENANGTYSALIEHWDGAHWTQQTGTINPGGASNVLYGVKALSATNIWAVGIYYSNDGHGDHALIVHSTDGVHWSQDTSSYSGADTLTAIDGVQTNPTDNTTADAWAVGVDGSGNALTLHLGSSGHFSQQSNVSPNSNTTLEGVSEYSSGDVWAVGYSINNGYHTFTMHYSSGSWTTNSTSPNPGSNGSLLKGVVNRGSGNVWAVGYEDAGHGFLTHLSGSSWGSAVYPSASTSPLNGVAALSSSNIWAVGASNTIWHSNDSGSSWTQITAAFPSDMWNYGSFNGIAINGATGNTWPVGDYSTSSGFHQTLTNFFN